MVTEVDMVKKSLGRLVEGPTDALVEAFTRLGIDGDRHCARRCRGDLAHAHAPRRGRDLHGGWRKIANGLRTIRRELETGAFQWDLALEDVHMNIERRLAALVGDDVAGAHTALYATTKWRSMYGCSCGDGFATSWRSWSRSNTPSSKKADANIDVIALGHTHLQRAQPVRLAHLLAYHEMFARDRSRVTDAM